MLVLFMIIIWMMMMASNLTNLIDYNQENKYELALYIKILIAENKSFVEFNNKLISMCEILYNADCKFNIENPFT